MLGEEGPPEPVSRMRPCAIRSDVAGADREVVYANPLFRLLPRFIAFSFGVALALGLAIFAIDIVTTPSARLLVGLIVVSGAMAVALSPTVVPRQVAIGPRAIRIQRVLG